MQGEWNFDNGYQGLQPLKIWHQQEGNLVDPQLFNVRTLNLLEKDLSTVLDPFVTKISAYLEAVLVKVIRQVCPEPFLTMVQH